MELGPEVHAHAHPTGRRWIDLVLALSDGLDGEQVIHFDVRNAGVGPARLEKLVFIYDGRPVGNPLELLARCCGVAASTPLDVETSFVRHYGGADGSAA